jgi:squalene monooxygenase
MPNEWLPAQAIKTPGVILVGDARNIRYPLTGSDMTVALKEIVLLRDILDPASVSLNDTDAVYKSCTRSTDSAKPTVPH